MSYTKKAVYKTLDNANQTVLKSLSVNPEHMEIVKFLVQYSHWAVRYQKTKNLT
jgi:hypothetical protein